MRHINSYASLTKRWSASRCGTLSHMVLLPLLAILQGCLFPAQFAAGGSTQSTSALTLQPSSANIQVGQNLQFAVGGNAPPAPCSWRSSQPSILRYLGDQQFQAAQPGTTQVLVTCGALSGTANVVVASQQPSGPIQITSGGTYSGNWNSDDPNTPAVTIRTDQPVTIQNSVITSRGTLISVSGVKSGARVTIENVTGTALDPGVKGLPRGTFVLATGFISLVVKNCSIYGVSFGIKAVGATPSTLQILNNSAKNLEDRASDGHGGLLANRPVLGHFIILDKISASAGAEIAWNQVVQTIGTTSTEDVINIFQSQGSPEHPIWVHDNYMEGYSSTVTPSGYSGAGVISDGPSSPAVTAFVVFQANEIVHAAGTGVAIASGHDITAAANRIVSCGQDSSGAWFAVPSANAIYLWNFYKNGKFYNNTITGNKGGLVRPSAKGTPMAADIWANAPDMSDPGNSVNNNDFTDPCLTPGGVNLQAEDNERAYWAEKVSAAGELIGDQH